MRAPILAAGLVLCAISSSLAEDAAQQTICGVAGSNATDLMDQVRDSPDLRKLPLASERFELYATENQLIQWALTKPGEAAHPAATCRHAYQSETGDWFLDRAMSCDGPKPACDLLFEEFQQVDAAMRAEIGKANSGNP